MICVKKELFEAIEIMHRLISPGTWNRWMDEAEARTFIKRFVK